MKNKQLIVDQGNGDCVRACITSILNIRNHPDLPNVDDPEWMIRWSEILNKFGMELCYEHRSFWRKGYWIASVPSLNFPPPITHAIVMKGTKIYWDPSTKEGYKPGQSLLGGNMVKGGMFIELLDTSKLEKFLEFKEKYQ